MNLILRTQVLSRPHLVRGFSIHARSGVITKKALPRRADIPDEQLEAGVRPCLDETGSFGKGILPEQAERQTHHENEWSEGGAHVDYWPMRKVLIGLGIFFGTLFALYQYSHYRAKPSPAAPMRLHNVEEELGGKGNYPGSR